MHRFVRAGFHAACLQAAPVIAVACAAVAAGDARQAVLGPGAGTATTRADEYHATIAVADFLMVAAVAMLRTRAVTMTARQFAAEYRLISPHNPARAAMTLAAQPLLADFGLAAIALRSPPDWAVSGEDCPIGLSWLGCWDGRLGFTAHALENRDICH